MVMKKKAENAKSYAGSSRVPFEEAVAYLGSEDLKDAAQSPQSLSGWRHNGVPAHIVLPRVLKQLKERKPLSLTQRRRRLERELELVFRETHGEGPEWTRIVETLLELKARRDRSADARRGQSAS